jgi:uncharacterized membrane protein
MPTRYSKRLKIDVDRWVSRGLISGTTADALLADAEANDSRSISFGFILTMMSALLVCAAVLLVVASNWENIPRLTRVALLFALIATGYVGGALLKLRGNGAAAEAAWLVAAAGFGGGIALIGQMYHLSGDELAAILTWCAGTVVAAAALRSAPLTISGAGIATVWFVVQWIDFFRPHDLPYFYPLVAAAIWLVSLWTRSVAARHLLLLSLIAYAAMLADGNTLSVTSLLMLTSAAIFALAVAAPEPVDRLAQLDGRLPLHALIGFLVGAMYLQFETRQGTSLIIVVGIIVFAGIAAALVCAGRQSRALRWVAYLGFACELLFLYVETIGSMLGTAGFFLAAGIALGLLALLIIRVERRVHSPETA